MSLLFIPAVKNIQQQGGCEETTGKKNDDRT